MPEDIDPAKVQVIRAAPPPASMPIPAMAEALAASGMFGIKTPAQAMALMCIAEAEGRHPATVAMDYHVIQGRPTLKAEAMLARYQAAGGRVEWHTLTDEVAEATFHHPSGTARIRWDVAMATKAGLTSNPTWGKYRRAMLRSRCVSEGVRTSYPGAINGMYTPEEAIEIGPQVEQVQVEPLITEPQVKTLASLIAQLPAERQARFWPGMRIAAKAREDGTVDIVESIKQLPAARYAEVHASLTSATQPKKGA